MPVPRVLILSVQTLFAESLRSILERDGCEVLAVQPYDEGTPSVIAALQPTVVILDTQKTPPSVASTLLDCAPNIRVVRVSLESQMVALYDHRQPGAATVQEFLDIVAFRDRQPPEAGAPLPGMGQGPG